MNLKAIFRRKRSYKNMKPYLIYMTPLNIVKSADKSRKCLSCGHDIKKGEKMAGMVHPAMSIYFSYNPDYTGLGNMLTFCLPCIDKLSLLFTKKDVDDILKLRRAEEVADAL